MSNFLRRHWPVLFFLLAAVMATIFSVDYQQSLRVQLPLFFGLLCYIAITALANTPKRLYCTLLVLLGAVFLAALFVASKITLTGIDNPIALVKLLGTPLFDVPNDALMFSIIAPLALGVAWTSGWWLRGLTVFYLVVVLVISAHMQSRQAVVLLLLGQVMVVALMRPRLTVPALLIGCVVGAVIDGLLGWVLTHKIFLFPRTYVWHAAWVMFLDRPWTGQGPGLFKDMYFTFLGKAGYVMRELSDRRTMPWAHNLYLEQLAERGIVGFFALLGLLGASIYKATQSWRNAAGVDHMRSLAAGVLTALILLAISGIAEATLSRLWVAVSLLMLAAFSVAIFKPNQN